MKYLVRMGLIIACIISVCHICDVHAKKMDIIIGGENFCTTDENCKGGTRCHNQTHICIKCATPPFIWTGTDCKCPSETPVQKDDETCVECLSDSNCAGHEKGEFCNTETNTCFGCPATFERSKDGNSCVCPKDTHEETDICVCDNANKVLDAGICKCPNDFASTCDTSDYMGSSECACCPASTPVWNKASGELAKCMTCSEATKGEKNWYNADKHECVECLSHNGCSDPNKPRCGTNNTCEACPVSTPVWNKVKGVCEICPAKTPKWDGKKCVECLKNQDCPNANQPYCNLTGNICQSCPAETPKFNTKTYQCEACPANRPKWDGKTCACADGYEDIKGTCYRICGAGQVRQGTTCECTNKCQVYNAKTGECDNKCPDGQVCRTQYSKDACTQSTLYSCYTKKSLSNLTKLVGRYNRERLYISDTRMSFQDATSYCEAYDMHLATVQEACNKDNENDSGHQCPNIQGQFSAYHHNSSGDLWINGGNTTSCQRLRVTNTCGNNHFAYNNGSFYALCAENTDSKTAKYSDTTRNILKKYAGWVSNITEQEAIYIAEQNNFTDQEIQHCSGNRNSTTIKKYGNGNYGLACLKRIKCPAGSYCTNNIASAEKCPAGYYCPIASASAIACTAGNYCPTGSSSQTKCPAGSYCPAKTGTAQKCSAGYYCPAGATKQTACSAGYYCPAGSSSQTKCPAGSYCPAGSATPIACPAGTYRSSSGAYALSHCIKCPAGSYCTAGSAKPIKCTNASLCPTGTSTKK